jgi:demethylmenaquinone methyltransferase/2-methoxy-6-polyprenyl-1,4-benzoquinol methylase
MSFVYMKVLESAPERYDRGMKLLTVGRLARVYADIAARLEPGQEVLDLGCGTGMLAVLLARRGCLVTGIDHSPRMIAQAAQRLEAERLAGQVVLRELGAVELDRAFGDGSFDAVTSTLVFSELSDDEVAYVLAECWRIVRPGGQLLIADEILPSSRLGRFGTFLFRLPFAAITFLLTQNTTRQVAGLGDRIAQSGFMIKETQEYLAKTLKLYIAERRA